MLRPHNTEPLSSSLSLDYVSINRVGKKVCLKESLVTVIRMLWKACSFQVALRHVQSQSWMNLSCCEE